MRLKAKHLSSAALVTLASLVSSSLFAAVHVVEEGMSIQAAINKASPGDTIEVMAGEYHETVYIDKNDIVLRGVVQNREWPVLDGKLELNDGVLVAGHGVTVDRLFVKGYKGNAIMTQGANNFRITNNRVGGPAFYGIFPQFGKNGLVANNVVWGIEDAAIYAGMCENVDILFNETYENVMGIETENSKNMLVEGNYVHDNTVGVVLTLVPGLPIKSAENTVVRNNFIIDNNLPNFAPPGSLAEGNPPGLGGVVVGADGSVWENNLISGNKSAGLLFADLGFFSLPPDPKADPRPDKSKVLDNLFIDNGNDPRGVIKEFLEAGGLTQGPDIFSTGKGRKSCVANRDALVEVGTERWGDCDPLDTSMGIASIQLEEPVAPVEYSDRQVGRLTYLAVCTGCHTYSGRIVGPPMLAIKALYMDNAQGMAEWIANPTHKRKDYPEMPPQAYLPEAVRLAVAEYILEELSQ